MNLGHTSNSKHGLTLLEVIVVIVVVGLLALIFMPALAVPRTKATRNQCVANLKQIGLAFQIFATDNDGKFPYDVSNSPAYLDQGRAWMHFQAMSNELQRSKTLLCPADAARTTNQAENFHFGTKADNKSLVKLRNDAVSYFVGVQISPKMPQALLAGDRNISMKETALAFSSQASGGAIRVGTSAVWSEHPANKVHGVQRNPGDPGGNAALADGSVEKMSRLRLQQQISLSAATNGTNANLLLFPQ
jgi:prepilin-type N-terminal cleavage/methylation domain-containing protein